VVGVFINDGRGLGPYGQGYYPIAGDWHFGYLPVGPHGEMLPSSDYDFQPAPGGGYGYGRTAPKILAAGVTYMDAAGSNFTTLVGTHGAHMDYLIGSDILGAEIDLHRLTRPTAGPALALVEHLRGVEEEAISKGHGGIFSRALPGDETRKGNLERIVTLAARLRQMPSTLQISAADWEAVQSVSDRAHVDYSSVNDGRVYQDATFDRLVQDMGENAAALPQNAASAAAAVAEGAGTAAGKVVEGATGVPPWAWKVGIGLGAALLGYGLFRVTLATAPVAARAYLGGRR
jgi:hypothetical protein